MQSQILIVVLSAIVCALTIIGCNGTPVTPPLCEPGIIEEMPAHIKKVCVALENSNQLSTALNAYIKNEAAALLYRGEDLAAPGKNNAWMASESLY